MTELTKASSLSRMRERPDCRRCGGCCVAPEEQDVYCDVDDEDTAQLSLSFVRKNVMIDGPMIQAIRTKWSRMRSGPLAGWELNTCVALRGSVLSRVSCSIYENRPRVCRKTFQPGDRACREVRRALLDEVGRLKESRGG